MILECVRGYAWALDAWLGDRASLVPPIDAVAGPAVVVDVVGVRYRNGVYQVLVRAQVIPPEAAEPGSQAGTLWDLVDRAVAAAQWVGAPADLDVRPGTIRLGDVTVPTTDVIVAMTVTHCWLPEPVTPPLPKGTEARTWPDRTSSSSPMAR